jgi:hypothetical protein
MVRNGSVIVLVVYIVGNVGLWRRQRRHIVSENKKKGQRFVPLSFPLKEGQYVHMFIDGTSADSAMIYTMEEFIEHMAYLVKKYPLEHINADLEENIGNGEEGTITPIMERRSK